MMIKKLVFLLESKYYKNNKTAAFINNSKQFLDPKIIPLIYAYSSKGISLKTDNVIHNGEVLDFAGQTVTCILGQNDPWVVANMIAFLLSGRPSFLSTKIGQEIYFTLPKKIKDISKMNEDCFVNHRLNNGSDAIDFAINLAYEYSRGKKKLISFKGSYHGQGHLPYGASHLQSHRRFFGTFDTIFLDAPSHTKDINRDQKLSKNDSNILEKLTLIGKDAFAVIIEPIQFNNNGNTPTRIFLQNLRSECNRLDIPLIFDEVQTGWGWLGKMTASEYYGVWPDIMVVSKSLTAGYGPLSAVIARRKFSFTDAFGARTNGADVRSLVAALAVIDRLIGTRDIPVEIIDSQLGKELKSGLLIDFEFKQQILMQQIKKLRKEVNSEAKHIRIGQIKGNGLARMIEIQDKNRHFNSKLTKQIQKKLLIDGGVFVRLPSNNDEVHTLFIKMPIVASENQIKDGFQRMKEIMIHI